MMMSTQPLDNLYFGTIDNNDVHSHLTNGDNLDFAAMMRTLTIFPLPLDKFRNYPRS